MPWWYRRCFLIKGFSLVPLRAEQVSDLTQQQLLQKQGAQLSATIMRRAHAFGTVCKLGLERTSMFAALHRAQKDFAGAWSQRGR